MITTTKPKTWQVENAHRSPQCPANRINLGEFGAWLMPAITVLALVLAAGAQSAETSRRTPGPIVPQPADAPLLVNSDGRRLIELALSVFEKTVAFAAAVDVNSVDRHGDQPAVTLAKESWRFSRDGGTNTFIRTRYTPFKSREHIESESFAGGRILAQPPIQLPKEISLPGFETYNMLVEMREAGAALTNEAAESWAVAATNRSGFIFHAWFGRGVVLPYRIEKRRGGDLLLSYSRTPTGQSDAILPARDTLHFYENGRITMTVLRSFSKIEEKSALPDRKPPTTKHP